MPKKGESGFTVAVVLYQEQLDIIDEYAEREGFSRSLAVRKIVMDWERDRNGKTHTLPAHLRERERELS